MYWTRVHCIFRIQRYNQLFQRPTRDISQFILIGYVWFKNELMVPTLHFKKLMESATGLENKPYNDFGGTIILIRVLKNHVLIIKTVFRWSSIVWFKGVIQFERAAYLFLNYDFFLNYDLNYVLFEKSLSWLSFLCLLLQLSCNA